jgi:hypothetical protein
MGGKFHLKLNNGERPIANKYREGKMKRTLKRELKVLEIAKREALETSDTRGQSLWAPARQCVQWVHLASMLSFVGGWGFSDRASVKINSSAVGEGGGKGRRAISVKSRHSTSAWIEEVMVRRLRLGLASLLSYLL